MTPFLAAAIQTNSSDAIDENIAAIAAMAEDAARKGARLIALPENAFLMRREGVAAPAHRTELHPGVQWARTFCEAHTLWMHIGSIRASVAGSDKPTNRSVLIDANGQIAATYDKIHLFDVTLPDGTVYAESSQVVAGVEPVVARTTLGMMGMSVCFDVRFAAHYTALRNGGAQILMVPSAFTRLTGKAHWEPLLRARAIENQAYVIAAAQCGEHPGGRETYGHSMMIDPWGEVLAEAGARPEVIYAEIDMARVAEVRARMPLVVPSA